MRRKCPLSSSTSKEKKLTIWCRLDASWYSHFITFFSFQESFRKIDQNLRKCRFPDEGDLKLFSFYTKSNCELECSWSRAEELCGCRPWHVPALESSQTCFVLGNLCWDQVMTRTGGYFAMNRKIGVLKRE